MVARPAINTSLQRVLQSLSCIVRQVREQRGALDFTSRETGVKVLQSGEPIEVVRGTDRTKLTR